MNCFKEILRSHAIISRTAITGFAGLHVAQTCSRKSRLLRSSGRYSLLTEVESRTQCSRPTPRTQKKIRGKAKYIPSEDRPSRCQGQKCSRQRTQAVSVLQNKNKGLEDFFSGDLQKKVFKNFFQAIYKILTIQKIVLSPCQFSRT